MIGSLTVSRGIQREALHTVAHLDTPSQKCSHTQDPRSVSDPSSSSDEYSRLPVRLMDGILLSSFSANIDSGARLCSGEGPKIFFASAHTSTPTGKREANSGLDERVEVVLVKTHFALI